PYAYAWSNNSVSEDISGIEAGIYTVTVTDANGCVITLSEIVTEPDAIQLSVTNTSVTCNGNMDGTIDLTVMGGVGPFSYVWSNMQGIQDPGAVSAGTYTVTVTDLHSGSSCTASISTVVTEPSILNASINTINVTCNSFADGSIDLSVSGGTSPYTYSWSNNEVTEDITGLLAGVYTVIVTDANGCTIELSETITEPAPIQLSVTNTPVSCHGGMDGTIDLTVTGGVGPFSYVWSNMQGIQDPGAVAAGTYTVTVTDLHSGSSCNATISTIVTEPLPLSISSSVNDVVCFGESNGSITVTVTGGTAPYSYAWATGETTPTITNLIAGSYTVVVTDANNCVTMETAQVNEPSLLTASSVAHNLLCFNDSTGSIVVTPNGGVAPYTYLWSTGSTSKDLTNIQQGTYTVYVTDANGCSVEETNSLSDPTAVVLSAVVSDITCFGSGDGQINLSVIGGTLPYSYMWSTGAFSMDLMNLQAGTYTVTVTDGNGCVSYRTEIINEPNALGLSINKNNATCSGNCDGAIDLTVNGGTSPYSYLWTSTTPVPGFICSNLNASNGSGGIMFDMIAKNDISINGLDVNLNAGNKTLDVYYKTGSYVGSENNAAAWTLEGSYAVVSAGAGTQTHISLQSVINATNGQTISFFIATNSGLKYSNGTGSGQLVTSDNNIEIFEGVGRSSNLFSSSIFQDRQFSGCVYYTTAGSSNTATSEDLVNLCEGVYNVVVTDANGCTEMASVTIGLDNNLDVTYNSVNASCGVQTTCTNTTLIEWNDANCLAYSGSSDYSEFTPIYSSASCSGLSATNLSRNSGGHSCNTGRTGGNGMGFCIGGLDSHNWASNASKALRFSVTTGAADSGNFSAIKFYELSTSPVYQNGVSGSLTNNYPTKYGVRVLKDGVEIFLQTDINTSQVWDLQTIDFSGVSDFNYNGVATFEFELYAYDPVGNGHTRFIWDLDEITLEGCCNTANALACDGSIDLNVNGGSGQYSYQWTSNVDSITTTNSVTVDRQIATGSDDAEEYVSDGNMLLSGNHLDMSYQSTSEQLVGMRFQNLNIPQGATITSASLEFVAKFSESSHSNLVFYAEDADNSSTFTSAHYDISSRGLSQNSVAWNNVPSWSTNQHYNSPDLASLVQETVDRAGWASGNALSFIVDGTGQRPAI
ncbi:MAG: hypothetical protein HKO56_05890, partial [Bacteroidia bacterium]|nr:hypothetical protein [Bacteroidia bacterium]